MASTEWETPQDFFAALDAEFHFTVDACATLGNAKCPFFWSKENDGLKQHWANHIVWCNPPYDRQILKWVEKAYRESQQGATVVCLIQGRSTDTKMWHDWVMKSSEIRYIRDRLAFRLNGRVGRANISSVVVVFHPNCKGPPIVSSIDTKAMRLPKEVPSA